MPEFRPPTGRLDGPFYRESVKRYDHPPPVLLIAKATEKEATKYIEYLKAENKILRSKLPKRVEVRSGRKTNSAFDSWERQSAEP